MTKTEAIIKKLLVMGYSEMPSRSRKYRQFGKPGESLFYFIGKCAAVRRGTNSSNSFSVLFKV